MAKEVLRTLKWHIRIDNKGFIEANTDSFGYRTWADQMISIIITDYKILINSICNVDIYATQAITWMKSFQIHFCPGGVFAAQPQIIKPSLAKPRR